MRAWRFHASKYDPLDTTGAQIHGGRWNPRGVPVLYLSLTYAGGLLELLAHASVPNRPPKGHVASLIEVPNEAGIRKLEPPYRKGWDHPDDLRVPRRMAKDWLDRGRELGLVVPSVPGAPVERNLVLNGLHPEFKNLVVVESIGPIYDERIWG